MSREIKFRAWDKVGKKFLIPWPDGFYILGETTCFDLIGQQLRERNSDKATLEMLNDVVIMQYTGLKDKNGKEIYEGDIVDICVKVGGNSPIKGQVIFKNGQWLVDHNGEDFTFLYVDGFTVELKSNIYEETK